MYVVAALYKFVNLSDYVALRDKLYQHLVLNKVKGTLLLAEEGINGTICGTRAGIDAVYSFLQADGRFGDQDLGCVGQGHQAWANPQALAKHVTNVLGRAVTCVGDATRPVRRVAWCTGGAQNYFEAAIAQGVDVFITGEISEPQAHLARETGVGFLACGHHATERYGAPAVAARVAQELGIRHRFMDIDNPA